MRMLEIKVFDVNKALIKRVAVDEKLFNRYVREKKDLSTRWYRRIFGHLFYYLEGSAEKTVSVTDRGGTARTIHVVDSDFGQLFQGCTYGYGPKIAIGSGTTPPSIDDYTLESLISIAIASFQLNEDMGIVTISASFTPSEDITINEVGLFIRMTDGAGHWFEVLVDRTVLDTSIQVSAGQTATVAYKIAL